MSTEESRDEAKTIYPTRKCFDDSLDLFNDILKQAQEWEPEAQRRLVSNLYLVHAIVEVGEVQTSHAWVENDEQDVVYFVGLQLGERCVFASPRGEYRKMHNVIESIRYSYREAVVNNRAYGTYGPWNQRMLALCGNSVDAIADRSVAGNEGFRVPFFKVPDTSRVVVSFDLARSRPNGIRLYRC